MSAIRLLVLGAVRRRRRAHGYQVRADLEAWGAHEWSTATSGSVYHALKSMTGDRLLRVHGARPSTAGGPPRMEYAVTSRGDREYLALLRQALSSRDARLDVLAAAVGLIDDLSRVEALELLQQRVQAMEAWRSAIVSHLPPKTDVASWGPVGEVIGLWLHTADSRATWTRRLIRRLRRGAFRMAGESGQRDD